MERTDAELIDDYCRGSQAALATLLARHVDMVYAAAVRLTDDPGLADDVTQAVFIVLAKKARSLRWHATVAGWLIVVTRHVARAAVRARTRRRRHERAAARPEALPMNEHHAAQTQLSNLLDDALSWLWASDRDVIALRYLEARSWTDVSHALGISEEVARKRVARGVERLRESLARRGVALDAAGLSASVAAPPAPPATAVIASSQMQVSPSVISLSKGVLRMFAFKQYAIVSLMILLGLSAIAGVEALAQSTNAPGIASAPAAAASADATRPVLNITTVALQMPVNDVERNMAFFEKVGFRLRSAGPPDAGGRLSWATVDSGGVRIRMIRGAVSHHAATLIPYFWVDGGRPSLTKLHDEIAGQGVAVGAVTQSGESLIQFDIFTPDGYTIGFYTQPR